MPTTISKQGVWAYMDEQVQLLTPPNWVWKIREAQVKGFGTFLLLGLIAMLATALLLQFPNWRPVAAVCAALAGLEVAFYTLTAPFEVAPGYWQRYSLFHAQQRYAHLVKPLIFYSTEVKKKHPEADFQIAVLEQRYRPFGAILMRVKVTDDKGSFEETPLMLVDVQGSPIPFGAAHRFHFAS